MTSKPSVLIVEDSATNRTLIARMLEAYGCTITFATTGLEAVDALTGPEWHTFDIVLMDIEMPQMTGEEASRHIRAHEASRSDIPRVPIIALTASGSPEQIARYLAAGLDAHVTKPIDWPKLFATIDALALNRNRG